MCVAGAIMNMVSLAMGHTDTIGDDETPLSAGDVQTAASGSGVKVIQIAAGGAHSCALLDTGNVRCWGDNNYGQLGYGHTDTIGDDETPLSAGDVQIVSSSSLSKVIQIAAGSSHSCALLDDGRVRCWGANYSGQLGYGNTENIGDDELPVSAGDVEVGAAVSKLWGDLRR